MATVVQVSWDSVLNERTVAMLDALPAEQRSGVERRLQAQRRHVDVFHQQEWANIQQRLHKEHGIDLGDDMEPHWGEPWKAFYWQPLTNLRGKLTWTLVGPLSADAASIAHYFAKGWRTRAPEAEVVAPARPIPVPVPSPEPESRQGFACEECGKSSESS